jgi:hypothetical protein
MCVCVGGCVYAHTHTHTHTHIHTHTTHTYRLPGSPHVLAFFVRSGGSSVRSVGDEGEGNGDQRRAFFGVAFLSVIPGNVVLFPV